MEQLKYGLTLVPTDQSTFLKLGSVELHRAMTGLGDSNLANYFKGIEVIKPDPICRPNGDTTHFTTAGVQHIETIERNEGLLQPRRFVVSQPVIRSQYMDRAKNGTSTAFVNFSVESIFSSPDEHVDLSSKLIDLVVGQGVDPTELKFQFEEVLDKWGQKSFTKNVLTIYAADTEVGESVYIPDYPNGDELIAISDVCFGVERLMWGLGKTPYYFPEFARFYLECTDTNQATAAIDCIRTSVLIASEGVIPSHKDPGYRLRQLLKRFTTRNDFTQFKVEDLVSTAYEHWIRCGIEPNINQEQVNEVINAELDRGFNVAVLAALTERGGTRYNINVNQPTRSFLAQFKGTIPKEKQSLVSDIVER